MTDFRPIFERLGLQQYMQIFADEGFETWETILEITESDLDALRVKLGHRRVLQREIASARDVGNQHWISINSPSRSHVSLDSSSAAPEDTEEPLEIDQTGPIPRKKRRYRRHPKADENAPERPPSAYVVFSNKIRDDLRGQNLSFTEIAKRVGESWQHLPADEKGPYETQASIAKETFHRQMAAYKSTEMYRDYQRYLMEFRRRHGTNSDVIRLQLEQGQNASSGTSLGSGTEASWPGATMDDSLYNDAHDAAKPSVSPQAHDKHGSRARSLPGPTLGPEASPPQGALSVAGHQASKGNTPSWSNAVRATTDIYPNRLKIATSSQQPASQSQIPTYHSPSETPITTSTTQMQFINPRRRPLEPTVAVPSFKPQDSSRSSWTSSQSSTSTAATSSSSHRSAEDNKHPYVKLPPISTMTGLSRQGLDPGHVPSLMKGDMTQARVPPNSDGGPLGTPTAPSMSEPTSPLPQHERYPFFNNSQRMHEYHSSRQNLMRDERQLKFSGASQLNAPHDRLSILANVANKSHDRHQDASG